MTNNDKAKYILDDLLHFVTLSSDKDIVEDVIAHSLSKIAKIKKNDRGAGRKKRLTGEDENNILIDYYNKVKVEQIAVNNKVSGSTIFKIVKKSKTALANKD